jgi:uncharacterized phage-associated protein
MVTTATQVAEWIVRHSAEDLDAPVDPMSLEKLLYYAQCFFLVTNRTPLFGDEVRAWRNGPIVRAVYNAYARFDANPIILRDGSWPSLEEKVESHLEEVVGFFGSYTGLKLASATHAEDPWKNARQGYRRIDPSDEPMPVEQLKAYYCTLVADGEDALSSHELLDVVPTPRWGTYYLAGICARRMLDHPLYDISLAKKLAEPVPPAPALAPDFYKPARKKEYIDPGDIWGLSSEQIAERISNSLDDGSSSHTKRDMGAPKKK